MAVPVAARAAGNATRVPRAAAVVAAWECSVGLLGEWGEWPTGSARRSTACSRGELAVSRVAVNRPVACVVRHVPRELACVEAVERVVAKRVAPMAARDVPTAP